MSRIVIVIFALAAINLSIVAVWAVLIVRERMQSEVEPLTVSQIAGPQPPSIFCDEVGCFEMFGHAEPHTPRVRNLSDSYSDYVEGYPDGGKHRGAPEARVAAYSGYRPKHGGRGTIGWL